GKEKYNSYPKCQICGFVSSQLYKHVISIHEISVKEYSEKYNTIVASDDYLNGLKERGLGENNPMYGKGESVNSPFSIEFYLKKGYSQEDAEKLKEEKVKEVSENREYTLNVEYYVKKFNVDRAKACKMLKDRQQTNSVKNIAKRNNISLEEAQIRRNEITKKWVSTINNKSDEELIEINRKKGATSVSNMSIKFFDNLMLHCGLTKDECKYGNDNETAIPYYSDISNGS